MLRRPKAKEHLNPYLDLDVEETKAFGPFEIKKISFRTIRQAGRSETDIIGRDTYQVKDLFVGPGEFPIFRKKGTNQWYHLGPKHGHHGAYRLFGRHVSSGEEWREASNGWWQYYATWSKEQTKKLRRELAAKKREKAKRYGMSVRELEKSGLTDKQQSKDVKLTDRKLNVAKIWSQLQDEMHWLEENGTPSKEGAVKASMHARKLSRALMKLKKSCNSTKKKK